MYRLLPPNERRFDLHEMCDYHDSYYKYCGILRDVTSWTLVKDGNSEVPRNVGAHYKGTGWNIPENRHVETVRVFIESINLIVSVMDIQ